MWSSNTRGSEMGRIRQRRDYLAPLPPVLQGRIDSRMRAIRRAQDLDMPACDACLFMRAFRACGRCGRYICRDCQRTHFCRRRAR
jgi:hypothetical protein